MIKQSDEYLHLIAEGFPDEAAWSAVWINRAYRHLRKSGMAGPEAYAEATAILVGSLLDLEATEPEDVAREILRAGYQAKQRYPTLDPEKPESSHYLRQRQGDPRRPS